ncbi:MAG: Ig-like domain-containing protein, partial [Akkermansiaceae bacterium]|nr:Ig-like domain-containing protein [Akkermansiaceae bacterium]
MITTKHRLDALKRLALAFALWCGLIGATTSAQTIIEVAGDGVIGDEVLTTDGGVAKVPADGSNWTTPGAAAGGGNTAESFLISPDVSVPTTGNVTLRVSHRYFFEEDANGAWDGGAIFVSVNGAEATYVPSSSFSAGSYDNTVGTNPGTAWQGGEEIFTGKSIDYDSTVSNLVDSVVDLGSFTAGDTVSVEFRAIWDEGYFEPDTNWEVATVTLEDSVATPILDADFTADGTSGFTVESNATVGSGAWVYPLPVNTFEADVDTTTADRYAPDIAGTTTTIDLNGAAIAIEILTGTLDVGDTITIFDLSGGTTLTGSFSSVTLPGGQWDISTLETNGTITCLDAAMPVVYEPFNDLEPNLDDNTPGPGLPGVWESSPSSSVAAESLKYGAIATQGGRMTSNLGGSNFQKSEVSAQTLIDEGLLDDGATVWFSVIMVKHPVGPNSNRRTYFSLGTGPPDGFDRIQTGPDSSGAGSGFTVVVNKVGNTGVTAQAWNDGSDGSGGAIRGATDQSVADGDTFLAVGKITWGQFGTTTDTFDLYLPDKTLNLGSVVSTISADFDQLGDFDPANTFAWIGIGGGRKDNNAPQLDEIRFGATSADVLPLDLSAPVLVTTDNSSGSGVQRIATFDEDVLVGTGDIRIVNETNPGTTTITLPDPQVAVSGNTLTITPTVPLTGGDTYHIEIDAGALTNLASVDFGGLSDPDEWEFTVDDTPPT